MNERKIIVLDTSVLLHDKGSIHNFPGCDVIIPIVVLDEIDKFKDRSGTLGENSRYVNRFLDQLRSQGKLSEGVILENMQIIKVEIHSSKKASDYIEMDNLDLKHNDNKILAASLYVKDQTGRNVTLISKDINLRVKAEALDLLAEDFEGDHVDQYQLDKMFSGVVELEVTKNTIDNLHANKKFPLSDLDANCDFYPNDFLIAKAGSSSYLGRIQNGKVRKIANTPEAFPIIPKNKEQRFCLDLLNDEAVELITMTGKAGTGKTFLTLVSAYEQLSSGRYKRIVVTRTLQPVGRDLGFLPGDIDEKVEPWMGSIKDNFLSAYGNRAITIYETMRQKGTIEICPVSLIRGRTFSDTILIVDEAQNSTLHELKTIITRVGENSKIILLGDIDQIDTPYLDAKSSGLSVVIDKLKTLVETGHVHLEKGERSNLASKAASLL